MSKQVLIVGAGFFGSVCARELTDAGHRCHVIDKRDHIGGNCFTRYHEEADCHQHVYGPHIFHTGNIDIWAYVNRFAEFNHFVNRPRVQYQGQLYSFPINLFTLYQVFGVTTPAEAKARVEAERIPCENPASMEEWCLAHIGPTLYHIFIEGYSTKQWQRHPRELPANIIKRLPVRYTFDDNYYFDRYQGIPVGGYTSMFERLLEGIPVELNVDFLVGRGEYENRFDAIIYTGPIDRFFGNEKGVLEYRSLRFESRMEDTANYQGSAVINYTDAAVPHTREVEHKHFDLSLKAERSLVTTEFSIEWQPGMTEYYPIGTEKNKATYAQYKDRAAELDFPYIFGGRLAEYRYYDMHHVIGAALKQSRQLIEEWR